MHLRSAELVSLQLIVSEQEIKILDGKIKKKRKKDQISKYQKKYVENFDCFWSLFAISQNILQWE